MAKYIDKIKVKINEDTFEEVALGTTSNLVFEEGTTTRVSEQIKDLYSLVTNLTETQSSLEIQLSDFNTQLEEIKTQLTDINNILETIQSTLTKHDERLLTIETQLGIDSSEPDAPEI